MSRRRSHEYWLVLLAEGTGQQNSLLPLRWPPWLVDGSRNHSYVGHENSSDEGIHQSHGVLELASSFARRRTDFTSQSKSSRMLRWLVIATRMASLPRMRVVEGAAIPLSCRSATISRLTRSISFS